MKNKGKRIKEDKVKQKKSMIIKKIIFFLLEIIFITILIVSGIKIFEWWKENNQSEKMLEEISKKVVIDNNTENIEDKYKVDFTALKEQNSDTVGFIKVENTEIEYPIVKSSDNDYYLNHSFDKSYNSAGWIFMNYINNLDGNDKNIVVFGHNRRDGSMFGSLKNILNEDWYNNENNLLIPFITENEKCMYRVFSIYRIENEDYYIKSDFEDEEFSDFLNTIKSRSMKDFNVDVNSEDKILTLSTCADNNQYRVVLHAKKIVN